MFTCFIRYKVDPHKLDEFKEYARTWITLIEKYGGTHHGYFLPAQDGDDVPDATFSFPGIGKEGPENIAVALFTFPDLETYETYRRDVAQDELCQKITQRFEEAPCFLNYERSFLKPLITA